MATERFEHHFPGYEILGQLGRGNARVVKARNQLTGELVAIKHFAINTDADTLKRFQRESEIMKVLQHTNIVKIREVRLEASLPYIVMELIEGGDLRGLLKQRGNLDTASVASLGIQLSRALHVIHKNGIVHRDIKPENIMYRILPNQELHFLLTDFGIAKLREQSQTVTGTSMMTYEYASPEQFDDPKSVHAATDFYSLGVVLYECLTGHVPFPLKNLGMVPFIQKVMNEPPPEILLSGKKYLPPTLELLIKGLLVKKQESRIGDGEMLEAVLTSTSVKRTSATGEPVTNAGKRNTHQWIADPYSFKSGEASPADGKHSEAMEGGQDAGTYKKRSFRRKFAGIIKIFTVFGILGAAISMMFFVSKWNRQLDNLPMQPDEKHDTVTVRHPAIRDSAALISISNKSVPRHRAIMPPKYFDTVTTTIEYPDGKYVGQVVGNIKNGLGTFFWNDGDRYSGYFANGEKEGKGTFYYKNRDLYIGEWKDGKKNGQGILYTGELTYEGGFADDFFDGFGTLNASENRIVTNCPGCRKFKGYWHEDMKQGFGECYDKEGQLIYQGNFEDDEPVDEYPNVKK